ncbi:L-serine ammonia-lyase [Mycolicibacterium frederiksbergense]|uniref:L-serine dehydratase n=1 Tax=Mycolicibacterium frederiksbergense TaxID=117567 RepID=A0A6H0RYS9_9MYCO|nr:L-serine ammonia-lyase [Mycolicibacterium frederiksbergense]QIV79641.1 L-serine ammonia-lyase [Mycolicibacterium frederiksbergense]
MAVSVFDIFSIGVGPSSSHTVGPMRAARGFIAELGERVSSVVAVRVDLYGSLAATGRGHGTPGAILLGLEGKTPEDVDPRAGHERVAAIDGGDPLLLGGVHPVPFTTADIAMQPAEIKHRHTNAMRFAVDFDDGGHHVAMYYSVGGGFIVRDGHAEAAPAAVPMPFSTGDELLRLCDQYDAPMWEIMCRNERALCPASEVRSGLLRIWTAMADCVEAGLHAEGVLPGGLAVRRRAPGLYRELTRGGGGFAHADSMDWLNVAAMAVNEENAAGGRVVTAPTNGAAGIVPSVMFWAVRYLPGLDVPERRDEAIIRYLLTAAAIAVLYKERASISGAEMGCQGEVGSACSMAAAGLAELLGGTPRQVENAAEIGIEHNLGLTCDPVGGLVQIPCIERNAIAAVKAVNAAKMALHGDGIHRVSLDQAIETMRQTGMDMLTKYKETSLGGLAVNVPEC